MKKGILPTSIIYFGLLIITFVVIAVLLGFFGKNFLPNTWEFMRNSITNFFQSLQNLLSFG